jgi:hypothetical protein
MQVFIAFRDPTERDPGYCTLWWNHNKNRFFKYIKIENGRNIWEHLQEKKDA